WPSCWTAIVGVDEREPVSVTSTVSGRWVGGLLIQPAAHRVPSVGWLATLVESAMCKKRARRIGASLTQRKFVKCKWTIPISNAVDDC
ncbi:hypothetical protein NEOLI_003383, partial [Neolecta irregularis DAH-3]